MKKLKRSDISVAQAKALVKKYKSLHAKHQSNLVDRLYVLMGLVGGQGWQRLGYNDALSMFVALHPRESQGVCKTLLKATEVCISDWRWFVALQKYEVSLSAVAGAYIAAMVNDARLHGMFLAKAKELSVPAFLGWVRDQRRAKAFKVRGVNLPKSKTAYHIFHYAASREDTMKFYDLVDWFPASKRGRAKFSLVFSDIISWAHEEASRGRRGYKPVRGTRNKIASVMAARTVNARKAKLKSLNR